MLKGYKPPVVNGLLALFGAASGIVCRMVSKR